MLTAAFWFALGDLKEGVEAGLVRICLADRVFGLLVEVDKGRVGF